MQSLSLTAGPLQVAGHVSLETTAHSVRPWRIQHVDRELFHPNLVERAKCPAGVRLTLTSDTSTLEVTVEYQRSPGVEDIGPDNYDLLVDGKLHQRQACSVSDSHTLVFADLPAGEHQLELYLPHRNPVAVRDVAIDDGATALPTRDTRLRWVTYGSSITQCGAADGPTETWPAIVANRFDLNLTCLGFGGQCLLDPLIAQTIRDLPADFITICAGINIYGQGALNERTYPAAIVGTVRTIREKHATTPMTIISPIISPPREDKVNSAGLTLAQMRELTHDTVHTLQRHGDEHLQVVNGMDVFGSEYASYLPDDLHPSAEGYKLLADRISEHVMPTLGLA